MIMKKVIALVLILIVACLVFVSGCDTGSTVEGDKSTVTEQISEEREDAKRPEKPEKGGSSG